MVGTYKSYPPLPPKPVHLKRRVAQPVLFALVTLALCGMVVEGCLIYHLYQTQDLVSSAASLLLLTDFSVGPHFAIRLFRYCSSHLCLPLISPQQMNSLCLLLLSLCQL